MVSDLALSTTIQDCFLGENGTNYVFNFFENSNEEIMGKEQKEEVLW